MVKKNLNWEIMYESLFLRVIDRIYGWIISIGSNLQSIFLFYMRLVWGHQCFKSGLSKFSHIDVVTDFFSSLNLYQPGAMAYTVAFFELTCGFLLFIGFMSRLASIPLIFIMSSALALAHNAAFVEMRFLFEPQALVRQAPYPFLITALLIFIFGPGRVSIDAWLKRWVENRPKY